MNKENEERLDSMLKTIKESTINIVDSKEITPEVLRAEIYRKGLIYNWLHHDKVSFPKAVT